MYDTQRRLAAAIIVLLALGFAVAFILQHHPHKPPEPQLISHKSPRVELLGTTAQVTAVAFDYNTANNAAQSALDVLSRVDNLLNAANPGSDIARINQEAASAPVTVDPLTFEIIEKSIAWSKKSSGAFDITIGPLVDLWKSAAEANSIPAVQDLEAVKLLIGSDKIILDPNHKTVRLAAQGMHLDLDAVIKGFAVDLAAKEMKHLGVKGGMVEAGPDLACFGTPPHNRRTWRVGIEDPNTANAGSFKILLGINDCAVASSGDYFRYTMISGRHLSQILDPNTTQTAGIFSSITVIAPSAFEADILAASVSVLGPEKGLTLVESTTAASAILIGPAPQYEIIKSSSADKYIRLVEKGN